MMIGKNNVSLASMKAAGERLAQLFGELGAVVRPGIATLEIDAYVAAYLKKHDLISQTKGYHGYRYVSCISVNDEVVHGIPSARLVQAGDLVKVDVCAALHGYCADMARCFVVDTASDAIRNLIATAQASLEAGIAAATPQARVGDVSSAIQQEVERAGYGVVRDFAGHGIGRSMHEEPEVLNYGIAGRGPRLRPGMALAIEPMITQGKYDVYVDRDGWTVKTVDRSLAAHVEDTVFITDHGPVITTRLS